MNENVRCILFHGASGSGKTTVAREITPGAQNIENEDGSTTVIEWDHKSLAGPLVALHGIKTDTTGPDSKSRQLWLIHNLFVELFPYGSINYEDLIELVYAVYEYDLQVVRNSETDAMVRDRDFMTYVADLCHELYPNVFAHHVIRNIERENITRSRSHEDDDNTVFGYSVIISDLRLVPELEAFREKFSNLVLIKFSVSEKQQKERLLERDGQLLTEKQRAHPTQSSPFSDDIFDLIVNTDTLEIDDVVSMVRHDLFNSKEIADANKTH